MKLFDSGHEDINEILNFFKLKKNVSVELKFSDLTSLKMFTFLRAFSDTPGVK